MANIIIPNQERREQAEYIASKYGVDRSDPAMREAAEIAAARTKEAIDYSQERRRYYC